MDQRTVAGEDIELLVSALSKFMHRKTKDGMVQLSATLDRELGAPLQRALLRIERELLNADLAGGGPIERTSEQRGADAFVLLVERLTFRSE